MGKFFRNGKKRWVNSTALKEGSLHKKVRGASTIETCSPPTHPPSMVVWLFLKGHEGPSSCFWLFRERVSPSRDVSPFLFLLATRKPLGKSQEMVVDWYLTCIWTKRSLLYTSKILDIFSTKQSQKKRCKATEEKDQVRRFPLCHKAYLSASLPCQHLHGLGWLEYDNS